MSNFTGVTVSVVSLSKNINPSLVLVLPRKTRPFISERLLMGRKESNQTKLCLTFQNSKPSFENSVDLDQLTSDEAS